MHLLHNRLQIINRLHKAHLRDMKPKMHRMCKMLKLLKMSKSQERIKLTWMHKVHRMRLRLSQLKLYNLPELDEEDDAAMQQALLLSRQQAQSQDSDPQAASSAGATQSTDQELQHELQVGMDYQTEVQALQMKMSQAPLRPDEVARYRTVSQLWSANQARVAELCDRQVQESIAQQSRSTRDTGKSPTTEHSKVKGTRS